MPPPNPLTELAERVSRLTVSCRETDCLIFETRHRLLTPERRGTIDGEPTGEYFSINGDMLPECAPRFTASLDAAMTLAVKGYHILAIHEQPAAWIVRIGSRSNDREPTVDVECDRLESALCSAWLQVRARAASENSHG